MTNFNYNPEKGFKSLSSMLLTLLIIWVLVGVCVRIAPAIKWHGIIIGGAASLYILILYAARLPRNRKFRILGPLLVDGKALHFKANIKGEEAPISIHYNQITTAKYYRDSYIIETGGAKYRFQRICFDSADSFRHFREKVGNEYYKAAGSPK